MYDRSKKATFQSDSCLDSGFCHVCGGLGIKNILFFSKKSKIFKNRLRLSICTHMAHPNMLVMEYMVG